MSKKKLLPPLLIALLAATATQAQPASTQPQLNLTRLSLHPMPVTQPALQYTLLPPMTQRRPGNGAALYVIGFNWMPSQATPDHKDTDLWLHLDQELDASPDQFSPAEATDILKNFSFHWFDDAARCDFADWNPDFRNKGINTLLPHLNYMRSIADAETLRARLHIARNNFPQAQYAIQTTLSLAYQLNQEPVLVQSLIAVGIDRLALSQAIEMWITRPSAPNLYWPLANLPNPMIDLHHMQEMEQSWLAFTDPRFAQALDHTLPPDQWRPTLQAALRMSDTLAHPNTSTRPDLTTQYDHLIQTLLPQAKAHLRQANLSEEKIAALPSDQLVGQFLFDQYQALSDQTWKAWLLPYPQAIPLLQEAHNSVQQAQSAGNILVNIIPNAAKARATFEQLHQQIAALQLIEALRDYTAHHNDTFPDRLDQVTDLPLPNDPVTAQPFGYHRDGATATLELTEILNRPIVWRYELTIAH